MSHLKLVIFVYLTAFAIFGHEIEYVGSSTAALKNILMFDHQKCAPEVLTGSDASDVMIAVFYLFTGVIWF